MSLKMAPFDRSHMSSYWRSTVTTALSCIVSEIRRDFWLTIASYHTLHLTPPLMGTPSEFRHNISCGKARMVVLPEIQNAEKVVRGYVYSFRHNAQT